jgi:hypothetical protein
MNTSLPSLRPISRESSSPSRNGGRVCFSTACRTNDGVALDVALARAGVAPALDGLEKRLKPIGSGSAGLRYCGTKHGAVPRTATRKLSCGCFIWCRRPSRPGIPLPCLSTSPVKSVISRSTSLRGAEEGGPGRALRSWFIFSRCLSSSCSI